MKPAVSVDARKSFYRFSPRDWIVDERNIKDSVFWEEKIYFAIKR